MAVETALGRDFRDAVLGVLRYDTRYGWYQGSHPFSGAPGGAIEFVLIAETTAERRTAVKRARAFLAQLDQHAARAKAHACATHLESKNAEWLDDDQPPVSGVEFERTMELESLSFGRDGSVDLLFNDGGMFFGRSIVVKIDPTDVIVRCEVAGAA